VHSGQRNFAGCRARLAPANWTFSAEKSAHIYLLSLTLSWPSAGGSFLEKWFLTFACNAFKQARRRHGEISAQAHALTFGRLA
jgi:hypothetical protein